MGPGRRRNLQSLGSNRSLLNRASVNVDSPEAAISSLDPASMLKSGTVMKGQPNEPRLVSVCASLVDLFLPMWAGSTLTGKRRPKIFFRIPDPNRRRERSWGMESTKMPDEEFEDLYLRLHARLPAGCTHDDVSDALVEVFERFRCGALPIIRGRLQGYASGAVRMRCKGRVRRAAMERKVLAILFTMKCPQKRSGIIHAAEIADLGAQIVSALASLSRQDRDVLAFTLLHSHHPEACDRRSDPRRGENRPQANFQRKRALRRLCAACIQGGLRFGDYT